MKSSILESNFCRKFKRGTPPSPSFQKHLRNKRARTRSIFQQEIRTDLKKKNEGMKNYKKRLV
jgi:hypothetical protein